MLPLSSPLPHSFNCLTITSLLTLLVPFSSAFTPALNGPPDDAIERARDKRIDELIADFRIDDIPWNAESALRLLRSRSGPEKIRQLELALLSDDWQERLYAGRALALDSRYEPQSWVLIAVIDNFHSRHFKHIDRETHRLFGRASRPLATAVIRALSEALDAEDPMIRWHAALELMNEPWPDVTPRLTEVMIENLRTDDVALNADRATAILEAYWNPTIREALIHATRSDDPQQRFRAATVLVRRPDMPISPHLVDTLVDNLCIDETRNNAKIARRLLGSHSSNPTVLSGLLHGLDGGDYQQRQLCARLLLPRVQSGFLEATPRFNEVLVESLQAPRRRRARESVADPSDPVWISNAPRDALDHFLRHAPRDGTRQLVAALNSRDRQQRFLAAYVLGARGQTEHAAQVAPILLPNLATDRVSSNAMMAAYALCQLGEAAIPHLEPLMGDPDPQRQSAAWLILGDILDPPRSWRELNRRQLLHRLSSVREDPALQRSYSIARFPGR